MSVYLSIVQIIVSVVLVLVILLQVKGASMSPTFSTDTSVFRTRRGVEKTLFQLSLVLSVVFVLVSLVNVLVAARV